MSTDIAQAAISYFGLPENARMVEGGALGEFAFCIGPLTEGQMRGIADRMKAMSEPSQMSEGAGNRDDYYARMVAAGRKDPPYESDGVWYHADGIAVGGIIGTDGRYVRDPKHSEGAGGREVVHVDVPTDEQDALPGAVWVQAEDFEDYQLPLASDQRTVDWGVQYLLQEALLTDKQRAKYVKGDA
jgi:hypothetical protein